MNKRFIRLLGDIKEPEIFLGICRILKVKIMEGENPRPFEDLLADVIDAFAAAPRQRRKELLKIVEAAVK